MSATHSQYPEMTERSDGPEHQACEVPLIEQLRGIPKDYRTVRAIQWAEDGTETGHQFIPVGYMMHRAATELERLASLSEQLPTRAEVLEGLREILPLHDWSVQLIYGSTSERNVALQAIRALKAAPQGSRAETPGGAKNSADTFPGPAESALLPGLREALDEQDFYEMCQQYRHARDVLPAAEGLPNAAEAFEELKAWIIKRIAALSNADPQADTPRSPDEASTAGRPEAADSRPAESAPSAQGVAALKVVRAMIRGEQIEHAVVDLQEPNIGLGEWLDRRIGERK